MAKETRTLEGIVVERAGNRLVGCNVIIKGTQVGSVTDSCGKFSLEIEQDVFTLVFNHISSQSYEVTIKLSDIKHGEPVVFQLGSAGKIKNKACKEKVGNKDAWYKLG